MCTNRKGKARRERPKAGSSPGDIPAVTKHAQDRVSEKVSKTAGVGQWQGDYATDTQSQCARDVHTKEWQ